MPFYNSLRPYESSTLYESAIGTYGNEGTTFTSELNRLANGGVSYPANSAYQAVVRAANVWAGTVGLPLVAALNYKNGSVGFGLSHVCNALAGSVGKSETDALRSKVS